ncbi:MAG: di-trans,poly-cis-decaprenylcistransferase [Ruminococcaceae bacterium]|nr:di-trans,poly-cis-decaprenylcistransferase [Oscillospiraceae bacterium]
MFFNQKKADAPSLEEIQSIVRDASLNHIAFIMDGNGRWANRKGLPREAGHGVGVKTFKKTVTRCRDFGISTVTTYAFSTENWKRPKVEVREIMRLLDEYIKEARDDNEKNRIRYIFLGDKERLGPELLEKCEFLEELTKDNPLTLNVALNYGGRDEIVRCVNRLIAEGRTEITEEDISNGLYTKESPDPDLIVRTGGEFRLSNFLLWQSQYSELYFTDCLWPDFDEEELVRAIMEFSQRKRRFGGV